jgi:phosphoribosylformylglycinamidine cyclo-ligase
VQLHCFFEVALILLPVQKFGLALRSILQPPKRIFDITMNKEKSNKYKDAGVDIDKGNAFVEAIKDLVASTHQRGVLGGIGGFSSHVAIDTNKYKKPVIVNSTDGVGTKLLIAQMCNKHNTIGIDLVAMCVNDLIVGGATPLCFLDYFAVGKLDLEVAREIISGIAEGCRQANCSLVGGETAEMPGLYNNKDYDLAGFVTGIVDRDSIIDGSDISAGDIILGLSSSGLHSNGYSLVRKICFTDHQLAVDHYLEELGCTLGEELLKPTRIYVQSVLNVLKNYRINGMVHNTGGGFIDNIPRVLPKGCKAVINRGTWKIPPIFPLLQRLGEISDEEMYRTFNMGIGLLVVINENNVSDILHHFTAVGEEAHIIGEIVAMGEENESRVDIRS